jgi:hypothetical protein
VAIGATRRDVFPDDDDDDDATEAADLSADDTTEPAEFSDLRSNSYIAAWVQKTLLQTTFEVAFDAVSSVPRPLLPPPAIDETCVRPSRSSASSPEH